jgi:hypothetical protein
MSGAEFNACTADNPGTLFGQPGLLGPGGAPGTGQILGMGNDVLPIAVNVGGTYPADAGAASRYLIARLKYDQDMTPQERVNELLQLRQALRDAEKTFSTTEFGKMYKEAQKIPGLGGEVLNGIYAPTNIGSSLATGAGAALSLTQKAPTSDLLDIPEGVRDKLLAWARKSGNQGIKSAQKRFGTTLELVRVEGKWVFEIPVNKKAAGYVVRGRAAQSVVRIPAYRQAALDALEARNRLNVEGFGKTLGGHITGVGVGGLLALGPQAISDAIDADNLHQFASLEAHSQPANLAGWLAGWGAGTYLPGFIVAAAGLPVELPVLAVLAIGFGVGLLVQVGVSHFAGKRMGDAWDRLAADHHW